MKKSSSSGSVTVLVSPSEPNDMEEHLTKQNLYPMNSDVPEAKGADYLIYSDKGVLGWQRKEVPFDFISSVQDGRLTRELTLIKTCKFRWVLGEGEFKFFKDGSLVTYPKIPTKFTRRSIRKIIMEIDLVKGVTYAPTDSLEDTARFIRDAYDFIDATTHAGLSRRPGMPAEWGVLDDEDLNSWILQGFNGVGPVLAKKILDHFGEMPLGWNCTLEELMAVPGLTTRKAEELWRRLYS